MTIRTINERFATVLAKATEENRLAFCKYLSMLEKNLEDLVYSLDDVRPDSLKELMKVVRTGLGACSNTPELAHLHAVIDSLEMYYNRVKSPACDMVLGLMQEKDFRGRLQHLGSNSSAVIAAVSSMDAARAAIERFLGKYCCLSGYLAVCYDRVAV